MPYNVTLHGTAGLSDSSVTQAVQAFRNGLDHALGGPATVVVASRLYEGVLGRVGGLPLPLDASHDDQNVVARWQDAVGAAREEAFAGWPRAPELAHFEITTLDA